MSAAILPEIPSASFRAVAPSWHTSLLIAFFILMAAGGARLQYGARSHSGLLEHTPDLPLLYMSLIAGEWGLV